MLKPLSESKLSKIARPALMLGCLGFLVSGLVAFSGCGGGTNTQQEAKKEPSMTINVEQIDQVSSLDDKVPDGQYLVAKVALKNNTNASIVLDPSGFALENITENEKERYSQPIEKGMTNAFGKVYGDELKSKMLDFDMVNLYPRMQIERYFVFMVPSDAVVNGYQITYKPASVSAPLVTTEATVINDHRNQTTLPGTNEQQPSQP